MFLGSCIKVVQWPYSAFDFRNTTERTELQSKQVYVFQIAKYIPCNRFSFKMIFSKLKPDALGKAPLRLSIKWLTQSNHIVCSAVRFWSSSYRVARSMKAFINRQTSSAALQSFQSSIPFSHVELKKKTLNYLAFWAKEKSTWIFNVMNSIMYPERKLFAAFISVNL